MLWKGKVGNEIFFCLSPLLYTISLLKRREGILHIFPPKYFSFPFLQISLSMIWFNERKFLLTLKSYIFISTFPGVPFNYIR